MTKQQLRENWNKLTPEQQQKAMPRINIYLALRKREIEMEKKDAEFKKNQQPKK